MVKGYRDNNNTIHTIKYLRTHQTHLPALLPMYEYVALRICITLLNTYTHITQNRKAIYSFIENFSLNIQCVPHI